MLAGGLERDDRFGRAINGVVDLGKRDRAHIGNRAFHLGRDGACCGEQLAHRARPTLECHARSERVARAERLEVEPGRAGDRALDGDDRILPHGQPLGQRERDAQVRLGMGFVAARAAGDERDILTEPTCTRPRDGVAPGGREVVVS